MGVHHILGWYYGKVSWNRMWSHSINLVSRFGTGPRKGALIGLGKTSYKLREYRNGKEISRVQIEGISKSMPPVEIEKDASM